MLSMPACISFRGEDITSTDQDRFCLLKPLHCLHLIQLCFFWDFSICLQISVSLNELMQLQQDATGCRLWPRRLEVIHELAWLVSSVASKAFARHSLMVRSAAFIFKKTRHNEDRLTKPLSPSQIRSNKSLSLTHVHFLRLVAVHSECRQDGKKHSRQ